MKNNNKKTLIISLTIITIFTLICITYIMCFCNDCGKITTGLVAMGSASIGILAGILSNNNYNNYYKKDKINLDILKILDKYVAFSEDEINSKQIKDIKQIKEDINDLFNQF